MNYFVIDILLHARLWFFPDTLHSEINIRFPDGTDSCSLLLLMSGGVADNKWKDGRQQNLDSILYCGQVTRMTS